MATCNNGRKALRVAGPRVDSVGDFEEGYLNGVRVYSYKEAAFKIGCDHHWVRMMTNRGRFEIVERVEVRTNVLKIYINADQIDQYIEEHRIRTTKRVKLTEEEWAEFESMFGRDKAR